MQTFDENCVRDTNEMAKQRTTQFDETRDEASDVCTRLLLGGLADSCERFVDSENGNGGEFQSVGPFHLTNSCVRIDD